MPDGKTFFVRNGKLCYDIGWVGAVESRKKINDGKCHDVALVWEHDAAAVRLYIDGRQQGQGQLRPKNVREGHVVRIGYSAPNFPRPDSFFTGEMEDIRFFQRALDGGRCTSASANRRSSMTDSWPSGDLKLSRMVESRMSRGTDAMGRFRVGAAKVHKPGILVAGLIPPVENATWRLEGEREPPS